MCRWIFYYGEEVCIAKLIFGARHGLATMSEVRVHLAVRQSKPRSLEHCAYSFSLSDSRRALALSGPSHVGSLTFPTPLLTGRRLYARLRDRSPP